MLLQVLDDGRMTDGQGRTVDFKNTVIVMTSNLGSQMIQAMAGDDYGVIKLAVMAEVKTYFRPEFINRIDEVVVFHALDEKHIASIAKIQLQYLEKRLARLEMGLDVSDAALAELANARVSIRCSGRDRSSARSRSASRIRSRRRSSKGSSPPGPRARRCPWRQAGFRTGLMACDRRAGPARGRLSGGPSPDPGLEAAGVERPGEQVALHQRAVALGEKGTLAGSRHPRQPRPCRGRGRARVRPRQPRRPRCRPAGRRRRSGRS